MKIIEDENNIALQIISCAIEVHRTPGGLGLLESVYEECLAWELGENGFEIQRQVVVPIIYKGHELGNLFRIDLIVNNKVIIECKATIQYNKIFESQVLTYLRLSKLRSGFVINFGETLVKNGIHRIINGF